MKQLAAIGAATMVLALAVSWSVTAGGFSVLVTHGISMEPAFRAGDLAIVRRAADYGVGDVAAYRAPLQRTVVLHRIIGADGGRYQLQGDNNSWIDPEEPTPDAMLGKLMARVPQGGVWLRRASSTPAMIGVLVFIILTGGTAQVFGRRRRRREARLQAGKSTVAETLRRLSPNLRAALGLAGVGFVGAAALGVLAWSAEADPLPDSSALSASTLRYSYVAAVPRSAAYDDTTVTHPEPVFRALADSLDVAMEFRAERPVAQATVKVVAALSTSNGWRSSLPLIGPQPFSGQTFSREFELSLEHLQARADAAAQAIGVGTSGDVSVVIRTTIQPAEGAAFEAEVPFVLDAVSLRLADGANTPLAISHPAGPNAAASDSRLLSVLGRGVAVRDARQAAVAGLTVALLAGLAVAIRVRRAYRAPRSVSMRQRYASLLLAVEPVALPADRAVVDVPDIAGLARLAERYGLMVMVWERGGVHTFVVFEEHTTFRYRYVEPPIFAAQPETRAATPGVRADNESDVPASHTGAMES